MGGGPQQKNQPAMQPEPVETLRNSVAAMTAFSREIGRQAHSAGKVLEGIVSGKHPESGSPVAALEMSINGKKGWVLISGLKDLPHQQETFYINYTDDRTKSGADYLSLRKNSLDQWAADGRVSNDVSGMFYRFESNESVNIDAGASILGAIAGKKFPVVDAHQFDTLVKNSAKYQRDNLKISSGGNKVEFDATLRSFTVREHEDGWTPQKCHVTLTKLPNGKIEAAVSGGLHASFAAFLVGELLGTAKRPYSPSTSTKLERG